MGKFYDLLNTVISKVNSAVKVTPQTLTESEKAQARQNIGAASEGSTTGGGTGTGSADAVLYTAQTLTDEQKTQARTNIGAISENDMYAYTDESMMMVGAGVAGTLPGVLKWNGIIGGRAYVGLGGMYFVHVTDEVPTIMAELPNATICVTQFLEGFFSIGMPMPITQFTEDGVYMCGEAAFIIPYDNYVMEGIAFPKKGVYFMAMSAIASGIDISEMYVSSLLIPGYAFAESGGSSSGGGSPLTVTWDGNSKDVTSMSGTFVKVSDARPTEADFNEGYSFSLSDGNVVGANMCTIESMDGGILLIIYSPEGINVSLPFAIVVPPSAIGTAVDDETFYEAGLYFSDLNFIGFDGPYIASLTINGTSGGGTQTDWNQTDSTAPDFLKNKPFGMVYGDTLTLPTYSLEELEAKLENGEFITAVDETAGITYAKVSDSAPTLADLSNGMTVVTASGTNLNVPPEDIEEAEGAPGLLSIIMAGIYFVPKSIVGVDLGGGFVFPESGTYIAPIMHTLGLSLIIPGYTGFLCEKKLERKHLQSKHVIYLRLGTGGLSKSPTENIPVYKTDILSVLDEGFVVKAMAGATEVATMTPITVSYEKNYAEIEALASGNNLTMRTAEYAT